MENFKKFIGYFIITIQLLGVCTYVWKNLDIKYIKTKISEFKEKALNKKNDFKYRKYATINK